MHRKTILLAALAVATSSSAFAKSAPSHSSVLADLAAKRRVVNQPAPVVTTQSLAATPADRHAQRQEEIDRIQQLIDSRRRTPPVSP